MEGRPEALRVAILLVLPGWRSGTSALRDPREFELLELASASGMFGRIAAAVVEGSRRWREDLLPRRLVAPVSGGDERTELILEMQARA